MIKKQRPLTLAEVSELVGDGEKAKNMKLFVKQFSSIKSNKAKELFDAVKALDLIKLRDENIVEIVNFLPKDAVELNKIVQEASLDQEEVNKVLEITKNY